MAGINSLVRDRGEPVARGSSGTAEMVAQLRELIAPAQLEAEVQRLAAGAGSLSADQLLVRLTGLVSQAWDPPSRPKRARKASRGLSKEARALIAVVFLALLYGLYSLATGLLREQAPQPTTRAVTTENWYQVYFNTPKYPDNVADHQGGLDEKLTAFIDTAKQSVDMAIYQLDLPNVTQALLEARKRGRTVRVVTDIDILDDPKENPSFKKLQAAGITVVGGNPNAIMHDKFVVVDEEAVWSGSWNFTENDTYRYNNNAILIRSPELARNYTVVLEKMWRDKKFGPQRKAGGTTPVLEISGVKVENYFAPEDKVAEKIIARLEKAQKSIDFMVFSFTDDAIGQAVSSRVKVRGVFEKTGSETKYSEYGRMKQEKLDVLQDGNPYLMHHKVFIVDGATVILGSFNFSQNAEEENDENLLIIDDAALAQAFLGEFERVYTTAKNPVGK
jgi:phosphatidylserine/phosphatidylglycerophosphate/cardiolipin synthase-like enzyme